jgi:hypothetical protein
MMSLLERAALQQDASNHGAGFAGPKMSGSTVLSMTDARQRQERSSSSWPPEITFCGAHRFAFTQRRKQACTHCARELIADEGPLLASAGEPR